MVIKGLAGTGSSDYAWTADALGIRFYFHSDAVSKEKREELHDYTARAVTAGFSYADLPGKKAKTYAAAPDAYIAMIDRERTYSLPGNGPAGGLSVELTDQDGALVLCMMQEGGERQEWTIENADAASDFYIIRADGGFYLFRERIGWQEGFFYDLSRPDGGFGRLAYNTAQYFDSFLREILLALPYSPYCAHMAEVRRSFGESSYDKSSFVPHGHYRFPNDPDARYKRFLLKDEALQIDSGQTACRLLEDLEAFEEDADGNRAGETAVKAGSVLVFEDVRGEAARYNDPRKRSEHRTFVYGCRLADGQRICFESSTEGTVSAAKGYLNRFTEPVLKTEAASLAQAETAEPFMVSIGGKDYPVIPDYSHKDHTGEEIDFGGDLWWIAEGLPGRYVCTDEDLKEMRDDPYFPGDFSAGQAEGTELVIAEDGSTAFSFLGETFTGTLPEKRYYRTDAAVEMTSGTQTRTFWIIPREGGDHEAPVKIEFFSEGEPATNEPSKMPPVSVYLTKVRE